MDPRRGHGGDDAASSAVCCWPEAGREPGIVVCMAAATLLAGDRLHVCAKVTRQHRRHRAKVYVQGTGVKPYGRACVPTAKDGLEAPEIRI